MWTCMIPSKHGIVDKGNELFLYVCLSCFSVLHSDGLVEMKIVVTH
jgi:hypothetical protein